MYMYMYMYMYMCIYIRLQPGRLFGVHGSSWGLGFRAFVLAQETFMPRRPRACRDGRKLFRTDFGSPVMLPVGK